LETWDDGARRLLTLKISRRRLGGQPAVEPHRPLRTLRSSRCCLQVYRCVCVYWVGCTWSIVIRMSVPLLTDLESCMAKVPQIFRACCQWLWLGPPLSALQYVIYFQFCGRHMLSHNGSMARHLTVQDVVFAASSPTHNHFMALMDSVQHSPGEPAPERKNQSGFTGARDSEWQWHQLSVTQICTLTQHPTTHFFTGWMPLLLPNQQR